MAAMTDSLIEELRSYGAPESAIRLLKRPNHRVIDYLDLMPREKKSDADAFIKPSAVVESQGQALLYVARASALSKSPERRESEIKTLRHELACRGDGAYLAILGHGEIVLYNLGLSKELPTPLHILKNDLSAATFLQDLDLGLLPESQPEAGVKVKTRAQQRTIHELLFNLLTDVTSNLLKRPELSNRRDDVLSLVGRALFTRFLIDRGIMCKRTFPKLNATFESCFSSPAHAAKTCEWLDVKFNGELLPLADEKYKQYFERLGNRNNKIFELLSHILYRSSSPQISFDLYWNDINFAHVPIGLLSEVYERYAHEFDGDSASEESIHYTPRNVAEYMVAQAFPGITTAKPDKARILDAAAGAGVFLVLCFRRLVAERWKANGRPSRAEIRDILNSQIRGFDINSSALKLAALSLYLTALELDPDPHSVEGLEFKPLLGNVLIHARLPGEEHPNPYVLGSLGPVIGDNHLGQYDLVVGNPPWTAWRGAGGKKLNAGAEQMVRRITRSRGNTTTLVGIADGYENPDNVPDLPFVWRSMEWAKKDGVIALALHARLLFKRVGPGARARDALFSALRVTGVLNGAALRQQNVWPNIMAPWCLLFAQNRVPNDLDLFHFVSPDIDERINQQGRVRIDYQSAQPIQISVLRENPTLLKTLFRGTALDADIMRRIGLLKTVLVSEYWEREQLSHGEGYQIAGGTRNARHMRGMDDLRVKHAPKFSTEGVTLPKFDRERLHTPRDPSIYRAPLLVVRESFKEDRDRGCGILALRDLAYSESFFGYSAQGYRKGDPEDLIRYLYVLTYSNLFYYIALLSSSKFGIERDAFLKEDVDQFPMVPFESLSSEQVQGLRNLSKSIAHGNCPWADVDNWVYRLYGLDSSDQQVILDTLQTALPFASSKIRAQQAPDSQQIDQFTKAMEHVLQPFFQIVNDRVTVLPRPSASKSWMFLDITTGSVATPANNTNRITEWIEKLAEHEGASRIIVRHDADRLLRIGLLRQYRYWTPSRARLCAMDILREHGDVFKVQTQ